ncbi:ABC transporter ATP-binding protein [Streptomyces sp. NPDC005805]|uniref:ABC transporter ATP-binding protein n=1 Tax=Streptomyces sp. NPDC005805 TaxID=3157068 RepID=UPI003409A309
MTGRHASPFHRQAAAEKTAAAAGPARPGPVGGAPDAHDLVTGPLRRVAPDARRFLARRKAVLGRLAAWSLAESAGTFAVGFGVARAVDRGFLAGDVRTGLGWLAVAAVAVLLGAPVLRGVFRELALLTEPLRDGLVRRAVDRSIAVAADRGRAGTAAAEASAAVSRPTHQAEIARDSFAGLVLTLRSFLFTAAGALAGLLALDPALLLVVLPPLLAGLVLFLATLRPMAAAQRRALAADEALGDHTAGVSRAVRDIAAFGTCDTEEARGLRLVAASESAARALARWAAVRNLALGVAGQLPLLTLLFGVPWLLGRGVTAGALLGAFTYLVQALLPALHTLMTALGAAGTRLLVVLERFTAPAPAPAPAPGPAPAVTRPLVPPPSGPPGAPTPSGPVPVRTPRRVAPPVAVELCGVRVSYGERAEPVLDGLDLRIEEGEHLAVVGPSGIGKSTLTRLVAGLTAPRRGRVAVGGTVLAAPGPPGDALPAHPGDRDPAGLRVLVPQEAYAFTGTVRENLVYLRPDAGDAEVAHAVRELGAAPLVERLGGTGALLRPEELSHGERQLLSLVRAWLSPAPLLLLDEATCHLDAAAEARAEAALARRPGTLVVVAHRLSSAMRADRVLVLDGTRAVCGTHAELLERSPLYRDLAGHWDRSGS